MHVLILGGGVVGTTSAWYLAKAGHEVTVVDRQVAVALETSYANAGQVSPGYSAPWAAPGVPMKAIKWMMQDLAPLMIKGKEIDLNTLSWMSKMISNCNEADYHTNKARMMRLAEYSRDCFKALREEQAIAYDQRTNGTLQVFRTEKQVAAAKKDIAVLEECGVDYQVLDRAGCVSHEPALGFVQDKIVGGLRLPGDETGDCFKFTTALAQACKELGVKFRMKTEVIGLNVENGKISSVSTSAGRLTADAYLCAMGSYSTPLLSQIDVKVPVYPIKGYSLTLPIIDAARAPVSTIMDETYKVAVTRFDDRIRVGGTAEIASYNKELMEKRRANVEYVVGDLFPGGGDIDQAEFWTGLRPMTPDGTPILGETRFDNLFLNTGHGTLGWTMSLGSAKFVADIISKRPTDIDPEGMSVSRYR
ncbi:D-amino acid dehydrogenase [Neptunomonas sp. XY-337]|uniref:D-amino acid dehydrogenase n=1 Tax=Neptunomonas sp. XY-337 TaxID=2561897 RepID=UPI0010AB0204|nr:D-amino acid dehydrogenase [Neptunomonas sp. XY-337]